MPSLPPIANIFQVTSFGTWSGRPCDRVINYKLDFSGHTAYEACVALAQADVDALNGYMIYRLPPEYSLIKSRAIYLGDSSVLAAEHVSGTVGSEATAFGSHGICWTVRHPAAVRGRGKDGRTNFPGPYNGAIDGTTGLLNVAGRAELQDRWNEYQAHVATAVNSALGHNPDIVILNAGHTAYQIPSAASSVDPKPNTHRRWEPVT